VNSITKLRVSEGVMENYIFIRTPRKERRANGSSMIFLGCCGNGSILLLWSLYMPIEQKSSREEGGDGGGNGFK